VVGKGGPWLLPWLLDTLGMGNPREVAIVGDRMDTDIALGREGGLCTILPLTGGRTCFLNILPLIGGRQLKIYIYIFYTITGGWQRYF
jgi:hypothetical protein